MNPRRPMGGYGYGVGQPPQGPMQMVPVAVPQAAYPQVQGYPVLPPEVVEILRQQQDVNQALLRELKTTVDTLRDVSQKVGKTGLIPRYIEDIPGKRVPYTWVVSVACDQALSNSTRFSGSATLSEDGPYVITAYTALWQVTTQTTGEDADIQRAFLPPGRMPWIIRAATAVPVVPRDAIDFLVEVQLSGGDRLWQNTGVPAIKFYNAIFPTYVGLPGLVERNETMTVSATIQITGTAANAPDSSARGTFWWIMDGYKILRPIDYAEAQGWIA